MATREAPPAPERPVALPGGDIRAGRPYILSRSPLRSLAFRLGSLLALLVLDLTAVGVGLYAALVLRELYYGHDPILWGLLWDAEAEWLPFLTLVTMLVFWQADLYAQRERRAGFGRIASSLSIVALLVLAFGLGTGHNFNTFGLIPTALVITTALIGVFR